MPFRLPASLPCLTLARQKRVSIGGRGTKLARESDTDAITLALRALGHKERSEREISQWLRERVDDEREVEAAIGALIESGGLDDARFAEAFAADKRELKGWGPERIRGALEARGIGAEHVDSALAAESPGQELDRAVQLLDRRGARLDSESERSRALSYLARRGYAYETAYEAVRRRERAA
jgi:regulatory protein